MFHKREHSTNMADKGQGLSLVSPIKPLMGQSVWFISMVIATVAHLNAALFDIVCCLDTG